MRLRMLGVVSALACGAALTPSEAVAGPAIPAAGPGGVGIRLLAPAGVSAADPLRHSYIVAVVAPGRAIRRRVEIGNSTSHAVDVAVYPAAASIRRGAFAFASGRRANDVARWTSVSSPLLHLAPGGKALVRLKISVPAAARGGERYAVVWAEVAGAAHNGLRLVNRVGIRVYVRVGSGGVVAGGFAVGPLSTARSAAGAPSVSSTLRNTGSRALLVTGDLLLSHGPGGVRAGPFPAVLMGALLPGGVATLRVTLAPDLPRGPWSARLRLRSGQLERVARARLTFPPGRPSPAAGIRSGGSSRRLLFVVSFFAALVAAAVAVRPLRRALAPTP
jgi:hypothetical protein